MHQFTTIALFSFAHLLISSVSAHGYISTFTLASVSYPGYSSTLLNSAPPTIGWTTTTPDEGPLLSTSFSSPDFICRDGATPAQTHASIPAGSPASFTWTSDDKATNPNGWNPSHKGPIITYLAPCENGDCATVDKTTLKWTKIAQSGYDSTSGSWATDSMIANSGTTSIALPANISAGKYVLRNEIIALHRADIGEPEFYMQCANIEVTGSGSDSLSEKGVAAVELYSTTDKTIFGFDVYDFKGGSWTIPGPALYGGAASGGNVGAVSSNSTGTGNTGPMSTSSGGIAGQGAQADSTVSAIASPRVTDSASASAWSGWEPRGRRR